MKYIIDEQKLINLIQSDWELNILYNHGVDNWEGYGQEDYEEEFTGKDIVKFIEENFEKLESEE